MNSKDAKKIFIEILTTILPPLILALIADILKNKIELSSLAVKVLFIFLGIWFLSAFFVLIKKRIVVYNDNRQFKSEPQFNYTIYRSLSDDFVIKLDEIKGFKWFLNIKLPKGIKPSDYKIYKDLSVEEAILDSLSGPYCPKDLCEMYQEKTFFGTYKFVCPNCSYKKRSKLNRNTLMRNAIKIVELQKRNMLDAED